MALPTQELLEELNQRVNRILRGQDEIVKGNWYNYVAIRNAVAAADIKGNFRKKMDSAAEMAAPKVLQHGLTSAASAGGVATGSSLFPVGAVLGPWIAAATIIVKSNGLYSLYDIKEAINQGAPNSYTCVCGKCKENIQYIINKHERKMAVSSVSIFTAGLPAIAQGINSIIKSFQSGRPKERISKELVAAARSERACTAAMATIFNLSGANFFTKRNDEKTLARAVAIIVSNDWKELKSRW